MSRNKRRRKGGGKRWLMLLLLIMMAVMFLRTEWIDRTLYPVYYKTEIKTHAAAFGQDPHLIAAIIRVESNFNEKAVSRKGAVGIMQLMPDTAAWILEKEASFSHLTVEDAGTRAEAGIQLGTWYVNELSRQFDGHLPLMIAAYNAGPNRVRQWVNDQIWDGEESTVERIPYGETRQYVKRVLYYYKKYREIYDPL